LFVSVDFLGPSEAEGEGAEWLVSRQVIPSHTPDTFEAIVDSLLLHQR
jgi:hypothetical protein